MALVPSEIPSADGGASQPLRPFYMQQNLELNSGNRQTPRMRKISAILSWPALLVQIARVQVGSSSAAPIGERTGSCLDAIARPQLLFRDSNVEKKRKKEFRGP